MKKTGNGDGTLLSMESNLERFPMHRLKRVDRPTNTITDQVQRVSPKDSPFGKAARGIYGPEVKKRFINLTSKDPISGSLSELTAYLGKIIPDESNPVKAEITRSPELLTHHIRQLGYFLQADIVGISRVPATAYYSENSFGEPIDLDYKHAIVIVKAKDYDTMYASDGRDWSVGALSYVPYQQVAFISQTMAAYIRRLGYSAVAEHMSSKPNLPEGASYDVLIPPLLLWSGIGEVSRAGIILNPFIGLGYKAAIVLTDLPLIDDRPIDFNLQEFCKHCELCAEMCPTRSIPTGDKTMYNGYQTWKLDADRCGRFFICNPNGHGCNTCVKICPWTRPDTWNHNLVRNAVEKSSIARSVALAADRFLKDRRKAHPAQKWWYDINKSDES